MLSSKLNRRDFLRWSATAAAAAVIAACAKPTPTPEPAKPTEKPVEATSAPEATQVPEPTKPPEPAGWKGTIEFFAQTYTPTRIAVNPDPKAPKITAIDKVANAWMEQHPGVEVKFINAPEGDYHNWIETQLVGGTGPDIFWTWLGTFAEYADRGKAVIINDYLRLPNKYTPEDGPWMETFKSPFISAGRSPKGNYGGVPLDLVSTGMYTNKDMLKEVGIDYDAMIDKDLGSPKSWKAWMEVCKTLVDAGKLAVSPGPSAHEWWLWGVLADQICWKWVETMDTLNYHELVPQEYQVGIVSEEEENAQFWCNGWKPFEDPAMQNMYEVAREWSQYYMKGWSAADFGRPYDLFITGKLCMYWDGSWQLGNIQADEKRTFEVGSFWLPPVTKETSEFVKDPPILPIGVGGYGSITYGINNKCVKKGNVDTCIDLLMWLTTPANDELIVNEVPKFIPSVKKAKALPEVENMFVGETRLVAGAGHPINCPMFIFGAQELKWGDLFRRDTIPYLNGEQDLKTTMANLEKAGEESARGELRRYAKQYDPAGDWDLAKWPCQPKI